jgi:general secretion pathway protein B
MSYILDALKKSEEERRRSEAPDVTTTHRVRSVRRGRATSAWLGAAAATLLILSAMGAWLWWRAADSQAAIPDAPVAEGPAPSTPGTTLQTSRAQTRAMPPSSDADAIASAPARESRGTPATDSAIAAPASTGSEVIGIATLSAAERARLPSLDISTHVFADDASLREVGIDGARYREGDRIGSVRLEAITEDGILVQFEGRRIAVRVLEDWSY